MIHCNSCPGSPSQSMLITPHLQHLEQFIKMSERNKVSIDLQNDINVGHLVLLRPWFTNRLRTNTKTDCPSAHYSSKSPSYIDSDVLKRTTSEMKRLKCQH